MAARNDTSMTIRMNKDVKTQAQDIFSQLGMDMTTAINIFLRQAIICGGLPFDVRLERPNEETRMAMKEAEEDKDMYGPFESVSQMMEALNA